MFSKQHMTVFDWWVYYVLMVIPVVNIIVFIMILLSDKTNKSLKSFVWASILPLIIVVVLLLSTGILSSIMNS